MTSAEQFGDDQNIVVAEAAGFVPGFPVLVGTGNRDIKERAGLRSVPPDSRLEVR